MTNSPILPGRLGTPDLQLRDDPRADPLMIAAMSPIGLDLTPPPSPVTAASPIAEILEAGTLAEAELQMPFGIVNEPTEVPGVSPTVETTTGSPFRWAKATAGSR